MRLTRECDYAFVVLAFLARRDRNRMATCDDVAAHLGIPYDFLAKILQKLGRAGLVASKQGPLGGYRLARLPSEISFSDVFGAIDSLLFVECVQPESCRCPRLARCAIVEPMHALHRRLAAVFDNLTVADLDPGPCEEPVKRLAL